MRISGSDVDAFEVALLVAAGMQLVAQIKTPCFLNPGSVFIFTNGDWANIAIVINNDGLA